MVVARSLLCPVVVGRDGELDLLRSRADRALGGSGSMVVLVGAAGVGKSRLTRELATHAAAAGAAIFSGRAVSGDTAVPYRPLTEVVAAVCRRNGPPTGPELDGFEGHLARLVPAWPGADHHGVDESPVLLGEAIVRMLGVVGRPDGAVVLLEDLHWADAESLAVVEYLADALVDVPVLCVVTVRPEGAIETVERLRRHPEAGVVDLRGLTDAEVGRVVAASLGEPEPPPEVVEFVVAHCDGTPFLAEELLAGLVATGALVDDDGWRTAGALIATVPTDVSLSVRRRMSSLEPAARRVLAAASVLGRRFDWNLLPGVAETDARAVVDALRAGIDAQLIEVDGHDFKFRHVLTREAVLHDLVPPERADLARRALPAIEHAHPGLPGPLCELAADLAEAAGERARAVELLVESARRAQSAGALTTALATAERARTLARRDAAGWIDAQECYVEIAIAAGRAFEAIDAGSELLARMDADDVGPPRRAAAAVMLARAAVAAGDWVRAADVIDRARAILDADGAPADEALAHHALAEVEAVAAHVALETDALAEAEALARSAVEHAAARPSVACEALEVLGRVARTRSSAEAVAAFERAADLAETHGLTGWLLRARQEIALERWSDGDVSDLEVTRDLAARHGAMVTVAVMDLSLADIALASLDRERCLERASACVAASRRYGLATLSVAELWLAGAHALHDDEPAMEAAVERALARDPDDPRILGDLWGRVRASRSMVRDDRDRLRVELDTMMPYADVAPLTTSIFPNRLLWAMLSSVDDDDLGVDAQRRLGALTHLRWWPELWSALDLTRAVTLGRQGRLEEATTLAETRLAEDRASSWASVPGSAYYLHLVLAEAQIRDGWGDPVSLLRPAEAFFAARGYDLIARRCRVALGAAGEKMPRRGRGESVVPERLRAIGITSRELDVLRLVGDGLSNRDIAARLHLSPRTVERHVSNLFDRTGVRSRTDLATWVSAAAD